MCAAAIFLHDPTTMMAAIDPSLMTYEEGVVRVQIEGICRGMTVFSNTLKKYVYQDDLALALLAFSLCSSTDSILFVCFCLFFLIDSILDACADGTSLQSGAIGLGWRLQFRLKGMRCRTKSKTDWLHNSILILKVYSANNNLLWCESFHLFFRNFL